MYNYTISQIAGGATLAFMVASYFWKSKSAYLLFQNIGIVCLFFSYLFGGEYFAMLAISVSLARTLTFFIYERRDKEAPLALSFLFAALTVAAYTLVNVVILDTAKPLDVLYLIAQVGYAFVFRIRNIKLVRYTVTVPHGFAIAYNLLLGDMLFVAVSYGFELLADLYAIIRYDFMAAKKKKVDIGGF